MMATIYGLRSCDACRAATKAAGEAATFVDVRADGLPEEVLAAALAAHGTAVLNTRSTTWRGLSEAERAGDPADLIRAHPALMKRPLTIDAAGTVRIGKEAVAALALAR